MRRKTRQRGKSMNKHYADLTINEKVNNQVAWALARQVPKEPKRMRGKYIHDWYICGNCGGPKLEITDHYCRNCGQRITDASMGERKTKEEQNKYHQLNIFNLFDDDSE